MENRKLPNATAVLVLGILSVCLCWCAGVVGVILAIIALVLAAQDMKLYRENPELYTDYGNLNIGRIFAIIGLIISAIFLAFFIFFYSLGEKGMKDFQENLRIKAEQQQEQDS